MDKAKMELLADDLRTIPELIEPLAAFMELSDADKWVILYSAAMQSIGDALRREEATQQICATIERLGSTRQ